MQDSTITLFDERGAPTAKVSGPLEILATGTAAPMTVVLGDYYGQDVYTVSGQVVPRPVNPATRDGHTLMNLPAPCTIHINEAAYLCGDSIAVMTFSQPGTYRVRVEAWPYLDKEFTIENPA